MNMREAELVKISKSHPKPGKQPKNYHRESTRSENRQRRRNTINAKRAWGA